jgi:ATP-dependent Clp protease ATP-binding subunit ClpA
MFERFTERARQAVVLAQEEARSLGHNYIGTEHLLLGAAGVPSGVGLRVLARFGLDAEAVRNDVTAIVGRGGRFDERDEDALRTIGIDLDSVRRAVEESFGPGALERPTVRRRRGRRGRCDEPWATTQMPWATAQIPFTPRAKKGLELALRWAETMRHNYIGTEHLLLGLATDEDVLAARILSSHGIRLAGLRRAIEEDLAQGDTAS